MENTTSMVDYKGQFDILTSKFLESYASLETNFSQMKCDLSKQLVDSHKQNETLSSMLHTKDQTIKQLQDTLCELEKKVSDKSSLPAETSENKFDIIRGQAKEIALKDKEIIRLTEELTKVKEVQATKENGTHGWSPTSCPTPKPEDKNSPDTITLDDAGETTETTEKTGETDNTEKDVPVSQQNEQTQEEEANEEESDEEEYEMITYRKIDYFVDSKKKVYEIVKDSEGDDDVGKCIGDWVKQKSGKSKLVKH